MAWARIQSCAAEGGSGNAVCGGSGATPTGWASNVSAGTKLICYVSNDINASNTISNVKDGSGNTFTQIAFVNYLSTAGSLGVYAIDTPAGDVGTKPTITATLTSSFGWNILCQEISGLAVGNTTAAMLDGTPGTNTGTASPATSGAYSSSVANEFLMAVVGDPGFSATYTETGFTPDANNPNPNGDAGLFTGYTNSAGTSESMSWAINMTTNWATVLVAFKLFGSPAAPNRQIPNRPYLQAFPAGRMGAAHSI